MGGDRPKQFLDLCGRPLLVRTCRQFLTLEAITSIVIVAHPDHELETKEMLFTHLPQHIHHKLLFAQGGARRQDSVHAGLHLLPAAIEIVLVHDAARPFVDEDTIARTMDGARTHGAVIAAVPVKDTLKKVIADTCIITTTVDRSDLWQAQTPQAADKQLLLSAFANASATDFQGTDEASLLEHLGVEVQVVLGNEENVKITHPGDLQLAEKLLAHEKIMKIGHGYDAHRLVKDRKLILGGVEIPYHLGLDGHSDADVVCHALTDAVLGAMGAGDIGRHFPDSDAQYKNISSIFLLEQVIEKAQQAGLQLANADITIVCQQPKLAGYLNDMQQNLAGGCAVSPQAVNIKATTTEKMGFTGRGEGISAHAVVLMGSTYNGY
ncbi:2-C-methyl-D-erythritol 2,4-cyclodiphosphate synthase [Desulfobulbus marinus]|nr:2-C-methyl-D-erythritol 4-phosphate cytidylyltransferase [Desulfogranum marinum]MBM9514221.1 2-C-methyl-D-erythritol 2,4-cyclodiphosphate synthase [Desulfogranum marinum]